MGCQTFIEKRNRSDNDVTQVKLRMKPTHAKTGQIPTEKFGHLARFVRVKAQDGRQRGRSRKREEEEHEKFQHKHNNNDIHTRT